MRQNHHRLLFLDIDGTVVDGAPREALMEQQGLVVGQYGDENRVYPKGYRAFIDAFNDPALFALDTTIPAALKLVEMAEENGATVLFLTARDARHHCGTEHDLKQRGLWKEGARLICKPHRELIEKSEFKERMIAMLVRQDQAQEVVLVDNNRKNTARVNERLPLVKTFHSCADALTNLELWKTSRSGAE